MGVSDHYFAASPTSGADRFQITVPIVGHPEQVEVARGVFSPHHIDAGTEVLLDKAPPPPATGALLDLGCGWGPIALSLARRSPQASVWAVDVNERALELTQRNAERLGIRNLSASRPDAVPDSITFAAIWSNPPIRIGKPALHDLLRHWLPRLATEAAACLVVQRNLGADSLANWLNTDLGYPTTRVASSRGYRVLQVARAQPRS